MTGNRWRSAFKGARQNNPTEQRPSDIEAVRQLYKDLEGRSYKTYMSRLMASQRLNSRYHACNASLIATSTATAIASVALLSDPKIYGVAGSTLLVCVSILTLIASLVTSGLNYSGRSRDMFLSYRRIQQLSAEAERASKNPAEYNLLSVEDLFRKYDTLLDESENHTEADYFRAFPDNSKKNSARRRELALSLIPYTSLIAPVGLLIPLIIWMWP